MEKKIYLIKAYEGTYGGLHGMVDYLVEKTSYQVALETAVEMSYDIMTSYGEFYNSFSEEASSEGLEGDEFDEYVEECYQENIAYEIYEVIGRDNEDIDGLNEEMIENPDSFIKKYCKPV